MPFTDPCSVGDTWLVTLRGSVFNQLILNTFYYRVAYLATPGTTNAKQGVLQGYLNTVGGFIDKFLAALPSDYNLDRLDIQKVGPYRTITLNQTFASNGLNGFNVGQANTAMSIERRGELARRFDVGRVQLVGSDDTSWINQGVLQAAAKTACANFGAQMVAAQGTLGSTDTFIPVLSRISGGTRINTDILLYEVQTTARTMRRRTVGVGK